MYFIKKHVFGIESAGTFLRNEWSLLNLWDFCHGFKIGNAVPLFTELENKSCSR